MTGKAMICTTFLKEKNVKEIDNKGFKSNLII